MKLFYEALLRSRKIFAVNREGNKMTYYVKKCPKRLHRHMCCTQTQWSHHNCHHLEQGTQHLLFLCAGSSGTRELSSCLFTVYSSKIVFHHYKIAVPDCNAPRLHPQICGMGFARQLHCQPTFRWSGQVSLARSFFQIWKVSFIHYTQKTAEYLKQVFTTFNMHINLALKKES